MDKRRQKLIVIVALILFIFILNMYTIKQNKKNFEQSIQQLEHRIQMIENNLNNNITYLNNSINESRNDLIDYEIYSNNLNAKANTIDITLRFQLKHMAANALYHVNYTAFDHESSKNLVFDDVSADYKGGTSYECNITLPLTNNYRFNIIEKTTDGAIRRLDHDEINSYAYNDFYLYRTISNSSSYSEGKDHISMEFSIDNKTFGEEEFEIKMVELQLYFDGTLVYSEDITDHNDSDIIHSDSYRIGSTSFNQSESIASESSYNPSNSPNAKDFENIVSQSYYALISKKTLKEEFPDFFKSIKDSNGYLNLLSKNIVVTYKNGEQITLY